VYPSDYLINNLLLTPNSELSAVLFPEGFVCQSGFLWL
jgi:hypothetical protein